MKNDFREFYDENYIMHTAMSNVTEEELMHGEWTSRLRKYVDKVRTRTGKWKYIYPEDLKKKAENVKRDVSYAARNLRSKVTGQNKTFNEETSRDRHPYPYERQNQKAGRGMTYYKINRKLREQREQKSTPARSASDRHDVYGHFYDNKKDFHGGFKLKQSDYSRVMNDQDKKKWRPLYQIKAEQSAASKAQKAKNYKDYAEQQKKTVKSAASRTQKAKIYGDYTLQQKKKAAGIVSRAQKSSIYSNYAKKQTGKALSKARNDQLKDDRKGQTIINKRNAYTNIRKRKIRKAAEKNGIDTSKW